MRKVVLVVPLIGLLLAAFGIVAPAAGAAPTPTTGTVRVVITTPLGVPAGVLLAGSSQKLAVKPPSGTSTTVPLKLAPGNYRVQPQPLTFENDLYAAKVSASVVTVRAGKSTTVWVTFHRPPSAADFRADTVAESSVSLTWTAPAGATFRLTRRAIDPVTGRSRLAKVIPVSGTSVTDAGLAPGTTYAYGLYTAVDGRWTGPLALTVGTAAPAGSTDAAYVAATDTLLATPGDVGSIARTGTGVRMTLAAGETPRLLGSAVVLPPSEILEGGFLGRVASISADGRTLGLVPAGIGEAFDYYSIDIPEFGDLADAGLEGEEEPAPYVPSKPSPEGERGRVGEEPARLVPSSLQATCEGSGSASIAYTPSIRLGGKLKITVRTRTWLEIPVGASLDMAATAQVTGAVAVSADAGATSSLDLPEKKWTVATAPVPIALVLEPVAEFTVGGAVTISNIGVAATAGFSVAGTMDSDGVAVAGNRILDAEPLTPEVEANGTVGIKLGGALSLGPGVATDKAGVMAGLKGELGIIEAEAGPVFSSSDPRYNGCVKARFGGSIEVGLTASAWLGPLSFSHDVPLEDISGDWNYLPDVYFPSGCKDTPPPLQDLLGGGLDKISDEVGGGGQQWGRVDGFVPGQTTWVLSTGDVQDAVGESWEFASTNLGLSGSADLSALSGYDTYDAVYYQATLVPAGDELHVRYVFASEEYPEFVGREYNDVMAVYVDGVNCATVPGTDIPISVDTVNDAHNTEFYADNSEGAYPTAMDGLTVPLTCSVPVTPDVPVTVRIAVADSSDEIYDSAVALVDEGIWSD